MSNEFFDGVDESPQKEVVYIFGDTETTGLSPFPTEKNPNGERMTEIALVKTDAEFNIIEKFQMLINPERPLSDFIKNLTNINEEMVENELKYPEAVSVIQEFWNENTKDKHIIFVAHNAPFDNKFINQASQQELGYDLVVDFIDTVSIARELYPYWKDHKLDTCAKKFGVVNENHHRAMNDTMVLYHIGKRLIQEAYEDKSFNPVNFVTRKNLHYKK